MHFRPPSLFVSWEENWGWNRTLLGQRLFLPRAA